MKKKIKKSSVIAWHEIEPTNKQWDTFEANILLSLRKNEERVHD